MTIILRIYFSLLLTLFSIAFGLAQSDKIDSLIGELKRPSNDTSEVNVLNALGNEFRTIDTGKTIDYYTKALQLSDKINFQKGRANAYSGMAILYSSQKDFDKALFYYSKSLTIRDRIMDYRGMIMNLNSIGNIYIKQGR